METPICSYFAIPTGTADYPQRKCRRLSATGAANGSKGAEDFWIAFVAAFFLVFSANALAIARAQQRQARVAHGGFAAFRKQIINAADFVVERPDLVFRLENPKNGGMSGF